MDHTHEVRDRAYFCPVYEISFVGHLQLGRVSSHVATQQEGEGAIRELTGRPKED